MKRISICLVAVLGIYVCTCDNENPAASGNPSSGTLNGSAHERTGMTWSGSEIVADQEWRFLSQLVVAQGIEITGAWDVTFTNPTTKDIRVRITRLASKDKEGFQIAEYAPTLGVETVTIEGGDTNSRQVPKALQTVLHDRRRTWCVRRS